jgi:hypothetical protein
VTFFDVPGYTVDHWIPVVSFLRLGSQYALTPNVFTVAKDGMYKLTVLYSHIEVKPLSSRVANAIITMSSIVFFDCFKNFKKD